MRRAVGRQVQVAGGGGVWRHMQWCARAGALRARRGEGDAAVRAAEAVTERKRYDGMRAMFTPSAPSVESASAMRARRVMPRRWRAGAAMMVAGAAAAMLLQYGYERRETARRAAMMDGERCDAR